MNPLSPVAIGALVLAATGPAAPVSPAQAAPPAEVPAVRHRSAARAASDPAAVRTSTSYSIASEVVDSGGQPSASTNYSQSGSIGAVTGISTAASPVEFAKAGYLGQLYEVTGLRIGAAADSINERATVQLSASPLLDDGSLLSAVDPAMVSWTVVSGPVASVSSAGVATAGTVYQNASATVRGASGSLSGTAALTVLNVTNDDYGTYAGDGIDDAWQVRYFGMNNPLAGPQVDADGAGQTNLLKYLAGLDPLDPASRLVLSISAVPGQSGMKAITFSPCLSGRTYTLQSTPDLTQLNWTVVDNPTLSDNGTTRTLTDPNAGGIAKFYRLQISLP